MDSSVAAALLVEQGHTVIGVTMKTFCYQEAEAELTGPTRSCCGLDGIMDARQVADRLGIAHYVFDVEREFTRDVIDDFVSEYAAGRTPNPCVRCNGNTKFRDLLRRGEMLGCDCSSERKTNSRLASLPISITSWKKIVRKASWLALA